MMEKTYTAQEVSKIADSWVVEQPSDPQKSKDDPGELVREYINWLKSGNTFSPVGDVSVEDELSRSAYSILATPSGIVFKRTKPKTAELYRFKSGPMEEILAEIDKFWTLKDDYKKLGLMYCRGLLMYGPAGSGKTSIVNQVVEMITKRGDVVFYSNDIHDLKAGLKAFRQVEPERKVVVILEDADEHLRYSEQAFLHLLDGQDTLDGVLYLATTNYIDKFPPRLLRSGRFDKKIHVPQPPLEGRQAYLRNKLKPHKMESDAEIDRLAEETDGMSFGDLLELVTAVYALKEPTEKVLERLKGNVVKDTPVEDGATFIGPLLMSHVIRDGKELGAGLDLDMVKKAIKK